MDVLRELLWLYARYVTVVLVIGLVIILAGCVVYGAVPWCKAHGVARRSRPPQVDRSAEVKG